MSKRTASLTSTVLTPAMRPAVTLAAAKLDEQVRCPADVECAMARTRDEIVQALRVTTGCSNAAAVVTATSIVLAALKTMGVAWADEAIAKFDAVLAA